ncbi:MAG: hypothetical protein WC069_06700 [Candidatus Shapirobacteria bacterium]
MIKVPSNEATNKVTFEIVNNEILRHTIQFFYKTADGLRPYGSGVLALIHKTHFIITASHVANFFDKEKDSDLYIRVDKKGYINVLGEIVYSNINISKGIDMAYIKIDTQMLPYLIKPYKFLTIDKITKHNQMLIGMNYCVLGFPEINIKLEDGQLDTGASFFLTSATNEKPYKHYKLDKNDFFLVTMKGKGIDVKNGKSTTIDPRFYGISGGGLWYLIYHYESETKTYSVDYKLIGILTEFRKGKYFCLIANKIHLLIEALSAIEGFKFRQKKAE